MGFKNRSLLLSPGGLAVTVYGTNYTENGIVKDPIKDPIKLSLTEKQRFILDCISQSSQITLEGISAIVGINIRNVRKNIDILKANGIIKRVGARKNGYWKITSE